VKNAKIGAKKDKITEKRHFPMDFCRKTFNHSIQPILTDYSHKKWNVVEINDPKTQFTPY
jgi:hypothetical protein